MASLIASRGHRGAGHHRSLWPGLRATFGSLALDAKLAEGTDPASSAALTARARRIARPRERERLAAAIDRAVVDADAPPRLSAQAPLNRPAVRAARAELTGLVDLLRAPDPVGVRGVAMCRLLLMDGGSSLYGAGPDQELVEAAIRAYDALRDVR